MSLKLKYFTIEEADDLLPEINTLLASALDTKSLIEKKVEEWRVRHDKLAPAEEAMIRGQIDYFASILERQLNTIAEMGCVPKDLEAGLIDFQARIKGKEGYLCWKLGESRIGYWHGLTEGFAGRRSIQNKD